jgi:phosphocarrier protein
MLERELLVSHPMGLHAQASAKVVQLLAGYQCQVTFVAKGREVNAKSIMGVMLLAAGPGTSIRIRCSGEDELEALAAVEALFGSRFGET